MVSRTGHLVVTDMRGPRAESRQSSPGREIEDGEIRALRADREFGRRYRAVLVLIKAGRQPRRNDASWNYHGLKTLACACHPAVRSPFRFRSLASCFRTRLEETCIENSYGLRCLARASDSASTSQPVRQPPLHPRRSRQRARCQRVQHHHHQQPRVRRHHSHVLPPPVAHVRPHPSRQPHHPRRRHHQGH